jgi:hypothetical protein
MQLAKLQFSKEGFEGLREGGREGGKEGIRVRCE